MRNIFAVCAILALSGAIKVERSRSRSLRRGGVNPPPTPTRPDEWYNSGTDELFNDYVRLYGQDYSIKSFDVKSDTGYKLPLYLIKAKGGSELRDYPVLIMHDARKNGADWIGETSWVRHLADLGYDVWIGNSSASDATRFNMFNSLRKKEWDVDWSDMAHYDLPVIIEEVLDQSRAEKLTYIGQGQGAN